MKRDTHDIRVKTEDLFSPNAFLAAFEGCFNQAKLGAMLKTETRVYCDTGPHGRPSWERLADGASGTPDQHAQIIDKLEELAQEGDVYIEADRDDTGQLKGFRVGVQPETGYLREEAGAGIMDCLEVLF